MKDSTEEPRGISRYNDCLGNKRLYFDSQEIVRPSTLELFKHVAARDFLVRIKQPKGEARHLLPSVSGDKNATNFGPISPYVFVASCFNLAVNLNLHAPVIFIVAPCILKSI